ncbi:MAG: hypothetical protein LBU79_05485 [Planctomycetota bacterium]|jgi:predicted hydrolase (HD superfamily)|nr:hypothetical protein [Planctomycetota bacterium]
MAKLDLQRAKQLLESTTTEPGLLRHALAVSEAMAAMAVRLGGEAEYWRSVGYLHDYDYQKFPGEHLLHTEAELLAAGVDEVAVRAIMAHGWGICNETTPESPLEKSLYTVDNLTGIIAATALMRPRGIYDLEVNGVKKKMKDKKFAAKIRRDVILKGVELLGLPLEEVIDLCLQGMRLEAEALGIAGTTPVTP